MANRLCEERRCPFLRKPLPPPAAPVWARDGAVLFECPKGAIDGELVALVERYWLWKLSGRPVSAGMAAREMEAFDLLASEEEKGRRDGAR